MINFQPHFNKGGGSNNPKKKDEELKTLESLERDFFSLRVLEKGDATNKAVLKNKANVRIIENLNYLRTCVKYLLFANEASGRENTVLHKMLDESGNG